MLTRDELALLDALRNSASMSQAAATLRKAPSTISHLARMLEERFDALLFDRSGYRMQLTDAGRFLADEAYRIVEDNERLTRRIQQIACGWEERLSIVVDEILPFEPLLALIAEFDELGSDTRLRITQEVLGGVWDAVRDRQADLAICAATEPPQGYGLAYRELGRIDWVFAVSPSHPLASRHGLIPRNELVTHRAVVVADSSRGVSQKAYGIQPGQATLALPTMQSKILAQCQGLGIGWLPRVRVQPLLQSGQLLEKHTTHVREPTALYLLWNEADEAEGVRWWINRLTNKTVRASLFHDLDSRA